MDAVLKGTRQGGAVVSLSRASQVPQETPEEKDTEAEGQRGRQQRNVVIGR